MESNGPLDALPLWGVFVAILIVVLLSVECGYRLGRYRRNRHEQEKETPVGTMVAMQKKENRDHSPNLRRAPNPQSFQE
jgi:hypothetical protein